jgi:hypothetical protein
MATKALRPGSLNGPSGSDRPSRRRTVARGRQPPRVPLPEKLQEAIEAERGNLSKAESVLGCLTIALEYGDTESTSGPYYPDVAEVARDLVRQSINGLDSLILERHLARDRVKEASGVIAELCAKRDDWPAAVWMHCPAPPWLREAH